MTTAFLGFLVSMKFFILSASGISRSIKTLSAVSIPFIGGLIGSAPLDKIKIS